MKIPLILCFGILTGLISCQKDPPGSTDYRDDITGEYEGIRVDTYWVDTVVGFGHDTSGVLIDLTKSDSDSIIDISFNPPYSSEDFSFTYTDGQFIPTTGYHPPVLTLKNDSLYFMHQA